MKKIVLFLVFATLGFSQTPAIDYGICKNIIVTGEKDTFIMYETDKNKYDTKVTNSKDFNIVFGDLSSKTPLMIGNNGNTVLGYMRGGYDNFYLIEITGSGLLIIHTFYPQIKKYLMSKQQSMIGKPYGTQVFGSYECVK